MDKKSPETLGEAHFLCNLDELQELQAVELNIKERRLFAIRKDNQLHAYWNNCPHMGLPLNWMPERFLDLDKKYIQCTAHGALFTIATGQCVAGPCVDDYLEPVKLQREDKDYFVAADQFLPEPLINLREQALRTLDD